MISGSDAVTVSLNVVHQCFVEDFGSCSSGISSVSIVSLSGFGRRVMLASQNESGSIPSSFFGTFKDSK